MGGVILLVIVLASLLGVGMSWGFMLFLCWWEVQVRVGQTRWFFRQVLAAKRSVPIVQYAANSTAWKDWFFQFMWDQPFPEWHQCFRFVDWEVCSRLWVLLHSGSWTHAKVRQEVVAILQALIDQYELPDVRFVFVVHPLWVVLGRVCRIPAVAAVVPWRKVADLARRTLRDETARAVWYGPNLPARFFWWRWWLRCRRLARRYAWSQL